MFQSFNLFFPATIVLFDWYYMCVIKGYQIFAEIDTSYKDEDDNTVWNNVAVHTALKTLKTLIKEYYNKEIVPTLFRYEFLK